MTHPPTNNPAGSPRLNRRRWPFRDVAFASTAHTGLTIWAVIVIVPCLWAVMSSFKTSREILSSPLSLPTQINPDNYIDAWNNSGIGRTFFNTITVVTVATILVVLLGSMLSYVIARFTFPGKELLYKAIVASMMMPLFLAIVPLFMLLRRLHLLNTLYGLTILYIAFALTFTVFWMRSFFETLPQDVYEAAKIDGAGEWRTFFLIMAPMAAPGIANVSILNFVGLWNQFMIPLVFNTQRNNWVISQAMMSYAASTGRNVNYGSMFAAVVIGTIPVLILYFISQHKLAGAMTVGTFR